MSHRQRSPGDEHRSFDDHAAVAVGQQPQPSAPVRGAAPMPTTTIDAATSSKPVGSL